VYWRPATIALLAAVRTLRETGRAAWATIDAGPHVKVLTTTEDADHVARALANVDGVTATTISGPGGPAYIVGGRQLDAGHGPRQADPHRRVRGPRRRTGAGHRGGSPGRGSPPPGAARLVAVLAGRRRRARGALRRGSPLDAARARHRRR